MLFSLHLHRLSRQGGTHVGDQSSYKCEPCQERQGVHPTERRFSAFVEVNFKVVGAMCRKRVCFRLAEDIRDFVIFFRNVCEVRFGRGGRGRSAVKGRVRKRKLKRYRAYRAGGAGVGCGINERNGGLGLLFLWWGRTGRGRLEPWRRGVSGSRLRERQTGRGRLKLCGQEVSWPQLWEPRTNHGWFRNLLRERLEGKDLAAVPVNQRIVAVEPIVSKNERNGRVQLSNIKCYPNDIASGMADG